MLLHCVAVCCIYIYISPDNITVLFITYGAMHCSEYTSFVMECAVEINCSIMLRKTLTVCLCCTGDQAVKVQPQEGTELEKTRFNINVIHSRSSGGLSLRKCH